MLFVEGLRRLAFARDRIGVFARAHPRTSIMIWRMIGPATVAP